MKLKEDNIDIYNNSAVILDNKIPSFIRSWIIILIILIVLFTLTSFIPFNVYNTYSGYIITDDKQSYINLTLEKSDFPINKNNKLYIKNDIYRYKILSIKDNNILLSVKLKDSIKINNNIITVSILRDRTTLFKTIKNKIKKGFDL